ncbi:MAG: glycine cleavage system aminomethyltransferase GcvT [Dermatophilaceae bacterium]
MTSKAPVTSPLDERHRALGAKMADFSGWSMPIDYPGGGVLAEHAAVREGVGLFDVSHLGTLRVEGPGAADAVNRCLTADLAKAGAGKAQYTLCCDEASGGVVDDLIVYVRASSSLLLVPNCANAAEVARRLRASCPGEVEIVDRHRDEAMLAVQGPRSADVLTALDLPIPPAYMAFVETTWEGTELTVCRSGYTGELGFELIVGAGAAVRLWDALAAVTARYEGLVCGLGARDTLRTEMGYPLWGHELSLDVTPVMARLGWAVGWDKGTFWGKEPLARQRAEQAGPLATGLIAPGKGIPRQGCRVRDASGAGVGVVTSGTMSPTLRQGIALALLDRSVREGDDVVVEVRGRDVPALVKRPPFVTSSAAG